MVPGPVRYNPVGLKGQWIPVCVTLAFCIMYFLEATHLGADAADSSSKWAWDSVAISVLKATSLLLNTVS